MQGHRDLTVWQQAMALVTLVYRVTKTFPKDEQYGLTSQLRRAAVSVPSNIAEGYGRNSRTDFRRFLGQSMGSLLEVETQIEIASVLGYVSNAQLETLLLQIKRIAQLLNGLKAWCESSPKSEAL
ncbi:MAG: four helix bundle protein [Terriglobales bacterium]